MKKLLFTTLLLLLCSVSMIAQNKMLYGYITWQQSGLTTENLETFTMSQIPYEGIQEAILGGTLTEADVQVMRKTSLGIVPKYAFIVVAVPKSSNKVVTRDNGLGGKVAFSGDYAENGADVTWNGITYSLFGFYTITSGERFIYVDNKAPSFLSSPESDNISITQSGNGIIVDSPNKIQIDTYTISGGNVYTNSIQGNTQIQLKGGTYIVKAGTKIQKIFVR